MTIRIYNIETRHLYFITEPTLIEDLNHITPPHIIPGWHTTHPYTKLTSPTGTWTRRRTPQRSRGRPEDKSPGEEGQTKQNRN